MSQSRSKSLARESNAFNAQREELLKTHKGEYVVFKDEKPIAFFKTLDEAYQFGINKFGPDDPFLLEQILERAPNLTSLSWELGGICVQT
jgi:hypothetical protein